MILALRMDKDEKYMSRALQLAKRGEMKVNPNPMVGAVIVHDDRIISEGWHEEYGAGHAEVNAIKGVDPEILKNSKIYVSLEPCSHYGKTPPCADLIIKSKIPEVIVACEDPNPLVAGRGIKKLRDAGIQVKIGVLEKEAQELNKAFFKRVIEKKPYIILKWAETSDGFIGRLDGEQVKISNELSNVEIHKLRAKSDAILIGTNTAANDNPSLTTRHWEGKQPIRCLIDLEGRLDSRLNVFDGKVKTIVFTRQVSENRDNLEFIKIENENNIWDEVLQHLYESGVSNLLVEGGKSVLEQFIELNLWDEIHLYKADKALIKGIKSPNLKGLKHSFSRIIKNDLYYFFQNN